MKRPRRPLLVKPRPVLLAHRIIVANPPRLVVVKIHAVVLANARAARRMLAIRTRLMTRQL
jgi:hypothetical protein